MEWFNGLSRDFKYRILNEHHTDCTSIYITTCSISIHIYLCTNQIKNEFNTHSSNMSTDTLYAIGSPIGNAISIIINGFLLYSLVSSFIKRKKASTRIRVTASMCLATTILYNAVVILKILAVPTDCSLMVSSAVVYFIVKASFYLFFTVRMESAVRGSDVEFSPCFIKGVQLFVIVFFGFMISFRIVVAQFSEYDAERLVCIQTGQLRTIYMGTFVLVAVAEITLSSLCIVPYTIKLYKVTYVRFVCTNNRLLIVRI